MVIALLALVLLAALVFYIFNVGHQVSKRVETQNAADNAAISGGRWMARSFNTVAANNVEMSRLIALAGVLDAVPLAIQHTLEDQTMVLTALDRQARTGYAEDVWVDLAVDEFVRPNIVSQIGFLSPLNELFNEGDYDIARMTFFKSNSGERGELWQSIEALGDLNRATMQNLGVLAQQSAHRGAQISQREGGLAAGGLLLPWLPEVPWEEGAFEDFESAVSEGQLPDGQNDPQFNRGPFDVLFGQRRIGQEDVIFIDQPRDARFNRGALGWIQLPRSQERDRSTVETYFTTGTYEQLLSQVQRLGTASARDRDGRFRERFRRDDFYKAPQLPTVLDERSPLAPSLWSDRVSFAANQKINVLFPGTADINQVVFDPEWITDYAAAEAIVSNQSQNTGGPRVIYSMYLALEFRRIKTAELSFTDPVLINWGLYRADGTALSPGSDFEIDAQVWREELPENDDPDFEAGDEQYLNYYVWLGANIGQEVSIRNPYNIDEEERNALPGPVNFTAGEFPPDAPATRDTLKLFGVAHQPRNTSFWASKFDDDRPDRKQVAVAQAQVFNNHSWDLWTAMWHAQLTPIDGLDNWMEALEDPQGLEQMPWMEEEDLAAVTAYLRAAKPLMDLMLVEDE